MKVINIDELKCLIALRKSRSQFNKSCLKYAISYVKKKNEKPLTEKEMNDLKHEGVMLIAEFYSLISFQSYGGDHGVTEYLKAHNIEIKKLLVEQKKQFSDSANKTKRLQASLFNGAQILQIQSISRAGDVRVDQNSIGKLLTELMSFETCRKLIVLLARCGLLNRRKMLYVEISSTGYLEKYFRKYLATISDYKNVEM